MGHGLTRFTEHRFAKLLLFALIGGVVGALAGYLLNFIFTLQGPLRFVIGGAFLGALAFCAFPLLQKASEQLNVEDMTLQLPGVGEIKLSVDDSQRQVAWQLFIETTSRVSTQPLDPESGFIREALESLYGLFSTTRELLKSMQPSKRNRDNDWTVEMVAIAMLNKELRPFLSKWHTTLARFEKENSGKSERDWLENLKCREDLERVRISIVSYARGFGELAGVANLDHFAPASKQSSPPSVGNIATRKS